MKNKSLLQSFRNAFAGLCHAFVSERNLKVHILAAALAVAAGHFLGIDLIRWAVLSLTMGLVFICELINTSIEKLTDMVTSEYSDEARTVKDISAAAVLVSAIISVITGILVFYQPLMATLKHWLN